MPSRRLGTFFHLRLGTFLRLVYFSTQPPERCEGRVCGHPRLLSSCRRRRPKRRADGPVGGDGVEREAGMDDKTKEHALEYALILGVGAVLLALVFLNIHAHFIA